MTDLPAQDFAGLARIAQVLRAHRCFGGGGGTSSVAVAGIGSVYLLEDTAAPAARAMDDLGRTITTVMAGDADTALAGLVDLLHRLAGGGAAGAVIGGAV